MHSTQYTMYTRKNTSTKLKN